MGPNQSAYAFGIARLTGYRCHHTSDLNVLARTKGIEWLADFLKSCASRSQGAISVYLIESHTPSRDEAAFEDAAGRLLASLRINNPEVFRGP